MKKFDKVHKKQNELNDDLKHFKNKINVLANELIKLFPETNNYVDLAEGVKFCHYPDRSYTFKFKTPGILIAYNEICVTSDTDDIDALCALAKKITTAFINEIAKKKLKCLEAKQKLLKDATNNLSTI